MKFSCIFLLLLTIYQPLFGGDFVFYKKTYKEIISENYLKDKLPIPKATPAIALPLAKKEPEYCRQLINDSEKKLGEMYKKWDNLDFVFYYYFGLKPQITLTDIDLLNTIKNSNETLKYRKAVEKRILNHVKNMSATGKFHIERKLNENAPDLETNYTSEMFSLGRSTLIFYADGNLGKRRNLYIYSATVKIQFKDSFEDPLDVVQFLKKKYKKLPAWLIKAADCTGTPYKIYDEWEWNFYGEFIR